MLLAIDTSTSLASIALVATPTPTADTSPRLLAEHTWEVGQRHSVELLQRVAWLLNARGDSLSDVTALAVATGPGSFNGVRVAVTTAKSLAFALGAPVSAHSTLDVIARGVCAGQSAQSPVWALLDAGRGEVYAARYTSYREAGASSMGAWEPTPLPVVGAPEQPDGSADELVRYHVMTPARLAEALAREAEEPVLCGEWRPDTRAALEAALAAQSARARFDETPRRAWSLAQLALARLATGNGLLRTMEELAALEPLYLRRPAITTSAKPSLGQRRGNTQLSEPHEHEEGFTNAVRG